jgi:dipeptidyl aminopeptidase/acylaminoacyl peptidase
MTACSQSVIVPTGSATETVEIIATVRETGPWLVLAGPEGFWAYGAGDGSLSHPETRVPLAPQDSTAMPAPAGGRVAYITGRDGIEDLALDILQLPDGHIESIALIPPEHMPAPGTAPGDPAAEAVRAIFERTSIAWSPDGEKLAFVGLLEAGNADLYVVEMEALEKPPGERVVLRLTASPEQEIQPLWSPDGEWVIYAAAADFGTGAGMALAGVRVVRADGSGDRLLYDTAGSGGETWVGWLDERTLVVHSWTAVCGSEGLRAVDLETGEARALWAGPFNGVALDPGTGSLLVAVDKFTSECGGAAGQGLYFVPGSGGEAARLTDQEAFLPVWAAEAGLFFARTPVEVLAVDPRGSALVVEAPGPVLPSAGRGGGLAWAVGEGIWVGSVGDAPVLVFEGNAALPAWSADGEVLYFLGEAGLYRVVGGQVALFGEGVMGSVGFWVRP